MADNALTKVARIASNAAQGAMYKDAKGNIQIIKPAGDSNYMDFTNFLTSTNGTGGSTGGGSVQNPVSQLPSTVNLFSGSAVGNIFVSGPSANYDNIQDGLLITLSNTTSVVLSAFDMTKDNKYRVGLSSIELKQIKIPKEKLIVGTSFDISDQLSQYIGKAVNGQTQILSTGPWHDISEAYTGYGFSFSILSFGGATINVLSNTTLIMNLTVNVQGKEKDGTIHQSSFPIPVIQVNDYKN